MGTSADLNRILNVRVGRYFVSAKPRLRRAELRFGKPRNSLWEGFNFVSAKPRLRRAEARFGKPRKVPKGFNFVSAKLLFEWADSRFAEPRCSLQRERFYSFRLYEKNQKYPKGLRPSGLPGTIQSSAGNTFGESSGGTSRNRLFAQNGGEKALNRCDVRALQREDLERTTKE